MHFYDTKRMSPLFRVACRSEPKTIEKRAVSDTQIDPERTKTVAQVAWPVAQADRASTQGPVDQVDRAGAVAPLRTGARSQAQI